MKLLSYCLNAAYGFLYLLPSTLVWLVLLLFLQVCSPDLVDNKLSYIDQGNPTQLALQRQSFKDLFTLGQEIAADKTLGAYHVQVLPGQSDICMVTIASKNHKQYAEKSISNHIAYAKKYGYTYAYHYYHGADALQYESVPPPSQRAMMYDEKYVWYKPIALHEMFHLRRLESREVVCSWVLWIDADVLFTNFNVSLESVVEQYQSGSDDDLAEKEVLLSLEEYIDWPRAKPHPFINAGVALYKNAPYGRFFNSLVFASYEIYIEDPLQEQTAMKDIIFQIYDLNDPCRSPGVYDDAKILKYVKLLPQRVMDSFYYPDKRMQEYLEKGLWHQGDFIAHITASSSEKRSEAIDKLTPLIIR